MFKTYFRFLGDILKKLFPKGLFGRATLMVVLPMFFVQIIMAVLFWNNHWDRVSRRLAQDVIGEVRFIADQINKTEDINEIIQIQKQAKSNFDLTIRIDPQGKITAENLKSGIASGALRELKPELWGLRQDKETYFLELPSRRGLIVASFKENRIFSSSTFVVLSWSILASLFFVAIAEVFLRNQVRALRNLASIAEAFGKGRDIIGYRPHGATEVRQVGASFLSMRRRLNRYIEQRTLMLSGISHDMRTPLTRLKLELEMIEGNSEAIKAMQDDIRQMEYMMSEWLAFIRGEEGETVVEFSLSTCLQNIVKKLATEYGEDNIHLSDYKPIIIEGKLGSLSRALSNIIENALKYGKKCDILYDINGLFAEITISDYGDGISDDEKENVFRPFYRIEKSRNSQTGGVGLGLSIARDVITAHGGEIYLEDAADGGLKVRILLPL